MEFPPYIKGWSEVYSTSFTKVITLEQKMYTSGLVNYDQQLKFLRNSWNTYYWNKTVKGTENTIGENVQAWYQAKKAKDNKPASAGNE